MIYIGVINHQRVSICPVGIIAVVNRVTEAPSMIVLRVHNVSISTSATTKRSRGGIPVILAPSVSIPRVVTNVFARLKRKIVLWRNVD